MQDDLMTNGYYSIKDEYFLENQRKAGIVLQKAMLEIYKAINLEKSTKKLNDIGEQVILDNGCLPTFKGFQGFTAACCISINKELVHGIPSNEKIIQSGDVIKIDCGATYKGAIADMARTYLIGDVSKKYQDLTYTCRQALDNAIASFKFEKGYVNRVGNIGFAIKKTASQINAKPITELGGHGVENNMPHWFPYVNNIGEKDKGIILVPGTTICIEPMLTYGNTKIKVQEDGWTVVLDDIGVHFEDTIFIHNDRIEIITRGYDG